MLLGCIGDDFTGSSDIANMLAKGGMAVTQFNGVPDAPAASDVEAGVVALKSRTAPIQDAIDQSLRAAQWLLDQGCGQIFFKYCSTFDSTKVGNIGPVADALANLLAEDQVLFCPAFPATGRSVYQGNLFVGDVLLSESGMKDHPLTPMTDSDLRRWLQHQTKTCVKHIPYFVVRSGAEAISDFLNNAGEGFFIADAIEDDNLIALGKAAATRKLLTGGSGLALGLPENFREKGSIASSKPNWQGVQGDGIILSGSCSQATRVQVAKYAEKHPAMELTAEDILGASYTVEKVCDWIIEQEKTPLIYTSTDPSTVRAAQKKFGQEFIASTIETFFGDLAVLCFNRGIKRIVSAGGETSGAIVTSLGVKSMVIGPEIAAGVPALKDIDRDLVLALKSGNFGDENFFEKALKVLAQ